MLTLRQLTLEDALHMAALHAVNSPEDVRAGAVEVEYEYAFGAFWGDMLVAAASGYWFMNFLDLGVLIHPAFRRKGLGTAVVHAMCETAVARDIIPQYRCNAQNVGSRSLAKGLNFSQFLTQDRICME